MLTPETAPLAIAALAALCAVAIVVALLYQRLAGPSPAVQRRQAIVGSGSVRESGSADAELKRRRVVETTLKELDAKQKERTARPSLVSRMRQAGLGWSRETYCLVCLAVGIAAFVLGTLLSDVGLFPRIASAVASGLLLPHRYVSFKRNRRFNKFTAEFPEAVDVIVRGVKSGLPLVDCIRIISTEAREPVRAEFRTIVEDQTIGVPLDEAVQRLAQRVPLTEANFFAIVIAIQSRTGGSLSEALGNLSKVLRERKKMKSKIRAVSSEAKASAGIIGALPVAVAGLIYLTTPSYMIELFTNPIGHLVLMGCFVWMCIGVFVMRKMINFDF